jgi:exopolyphosphatase/guanosine-5'-triphosphate,3'-diphosphate pyrophosphatase
MTRVAAIDCGTNSTRVLVADPGWPLAAVERDMQVTRLGAGVDRTGHLDDAALQRTVERIAAYHAHARRLGAQRCRIAATSAIRDASDRHRFCDAVAEVTGVTAEVLSGEDEAAIAFAGATSAIAGTPPYLVLDVGGGSTELILGQHEPIASVSRQLGCVRLTERCLASDPPTCDELAAAKATAGGELDAAVAALGLAGAHRELSVVGVAGTVTTLAALELGLATYDAGRIHGTRLSAEAVAALVERLAAMTSAQRARLGPVAPGREDVLVAGAVVLAAALDRLGASEVLVSEADVLDGLALSLLAAFPAGL